MYFKMCAKVNHFIRGLKWHSFNYYYFFNFYFAKSGYEIARFYLVTLLTMKYVCIQKEIVF
jgi:hypothetical protein